jgi:integrase
VIHSVVDSKLSHLKPGTINRYVATMRAILRKAEREWEWLDRAPALRMRREPKRRIRWLKPEEAQRLLSELPEHQREPVTFALATGLRQSNVVNLEWSQVDMQRKVAWIHGDQAKAGNAIGVPLNESAAGVLRRQIGKHPTRVFTYKGRPLKSVNETSWGSALKRAGIEDFRWHDLRHTWASWLVQAGVPLSAVQELGAWETASMVRRYAHLAPEHLAPHAATIDAMLNVTSTAQLRLVSNGQ